MSGFALSICPPHRCVDGSVSTPVNEGRDDKPVPFLVLLVIGLLAPGVVGVVAAVSAGRV